MWLDKLYDNKLYQVYSIHEASKEFREKYPSKFILVYCTQSGFYVDKVDELSMEDLIIDGGCLYMFTYQAKLPKKILGALDTDVKLPEQRTFSACLDQYYEKSIGAIFEVYPAFNQVSPLFNQSIVIRAPIKKLKMDGLATQLIDIVSDVFKSRAEEFKDITVEDWLESFIQTPFSTYFNTCVIYPQRIDDKSLLKYKKLTPNSLIITYDARAKNYNEEVTLFATIGEAFEKKDTWVTVYDSYNGLLKKVTNALDKGNLKYKRLNEFSITVPYKHLKEINITYELTDFL